MRRMCAIGVSMQPKPTRAPICKLFNCIGLRPSSVEGTALAFEGVARILVRFP